MDTYKIKYSDETKIGGAYDGFNHEIAQIASDEDGVKVEFRSRDYYQPVEKLEDNSYKLSFEDGREILIYSRDSDVFVKIGTDEINVLYPRFSYHSEHGDYHFTFLDDDNLVLETNSDEIVMAISTSLGLLFYLHNLK